MRIVDVDCLSITGEITNYHYLELDKEKNELDSYDKRPDVTH